MRPVRQGFDRQPIDRIVETRVGIQSRGYQPAQVHAALLGQNGGELAGHQGASAVLTKSAVGLQGRPADVALERVQHQPPFSARRRRGAAVAVRQGASRGVFHFIEVARRAARACVTIGEEVNGANRIRHKVAKGANGQQIAAADSAPGLGTEDLVNRPRRQIDDETFLERRLNRADPTPPSIGAPNPQSTDVPLTSRDGGSSRERVATMPDRARRPRRCSMAPRRQSAPCEGRARAMHPATRAWRAWLRRVDRRLAIPAAS